MSRLLLPALILAAPVAAAYAAPDQGEAPEPPAFRRAATLFADAAGCRAHLGRLVGEARASGFDAAEGPYDFAAGDVRAHTVSAQGLGHRIAEYRCAAAELSQRSWTRSMSGEAEAEEEFTIESVARRAPWLKQSGSQQH
jgi:hypothetical protein